jgi:outer membrane protein assembly factor BamB
MSRLFVLAALLAGCALALAADWPCFRGPNRDNHSPDKGLLKSWPEGGPKLAWKGTGVGQGFSSVAVAGERVYTMGDKDGDSHLIALSRKDGKLLWEARLGEGGRGGGYAGSRGTPTVDGDRVYGIGPCGDLVCVGAADGKEKWRKSFTADYKGGKPNWDYAESPLIDGDRLVCVPGGRTATMLVLDKKSGEEVWKAPLGFPAGYSSVVISNARGVKQYVTLTAGGTIGVRASDGKLLWSYKRLAPNTANIPTPIVLNDQVFTAAGYSKGAALLTLSKSDDGTFRVKEEYYNQQMGNRHGGMVIVGRYVYGDRDQNGQPYCADWKTGEVRWKRGRVGKGRGSASLTYADGNLYVHYANGYVALVPVDTDQYSEKGSFKIPNSDRNSWAHPVVIDGKLYLREKDVVWCYDVKE